MDKELIEIIEQAHDLVRAEVDRRQELYREAKESDASKAMRVARLEEWTISIKTMNSLLAIWGVLLGESVEDIHHTL